MYYVIRLGSYRQKPLEKSQFEPNSEPTNDEIVSNHWNEQSWHSVKVFWGLKVYMLRAVKSSRKWCHHHAIFSGIWSWTTTARYNNLNLTLSSCDDVSASCIIKVLLSSNVIIMQTIIFALLRCHSVTAENLVHMENVVPTMISNKVIWSAEKQFFALNNNQRPEYEVQWRSSFLAWWHNNYRHFEHTHPITHVFMLICASNDWTAAHSENEFVSHLFI